MTVPAEPSRNGSSIVKWLAIFTGISLLIAAAAIFGTNVFSGGAPEQEKADSVSSPDAGTRDLAEQQLPSDLADFTRDDPGLHGETPWKQKKGGGSELLTWQFGKVTEASDDSVSVRSKDDTTWKWSLDKNTAVHPGDETPEKGDDVYVLGTRNDKKDNDRTADHLVNAGTEESRSRGPVIETPDNCEKKEKKGQFTITCSPTGKENPSDEQESGAPSDSKSV